ncbi:phosphoglycerate kinase [Candidatus Saccharibacteria bacterium]|nr:phosphoglycerate kinase [Candidatus Saccharibacteria bacterium]
MAVDQLPLKRLQDVDVAGQTVLVRVDYNVPLTDDGQISDDSRIRASLPTIHYLLDHDAKRVILCSHLGRPGGKVVPELSLKPVAQRLETLLDTPIFAAAMSSPAPYHCELVSESDPKILKQVQDDKITLLENLRFDPGEEADSPEFAKQLVESTGAQVFVQDAFSVLHRTSATTDAITRLLPSVAGLLVEKEVKTLTAALNKPTRPFVAVIGGAKIADKVGFVQKIVQIADQVLIGGALANTFFQGHSLKVGKSLVDADGLGVAKQILAENGQKIILPTDVVVAGEINEDANVLEKSVNNVLDNDIILDIGSQTVAEFTTVISTAKTILWNGNLGYSEIDRFATATAMVAKAIGENTTATTIIGGGDTAGFVHNYQKTHKNLKYSLISTGGGATLAFIAGEPLPGLEALK